MPDENDIKIKLPQLPLYEGDVKGDDMVYVWETATAKLKHANVSQLPFGSGGGPGQTLLGSPFKVRLGDDQVTIEGDDTVISDVRLLGKTDYPVSSTQLNNVAFRDGELDYDDEAGKVTLLDFKLQGGESVILYPDGVQSGGSGGGSLQPVLDRLATLEAMTAPFKPTVNGENAGRVWWTGSVESIPLGWAEDTEWTGKFPVALNTTDDDFNAIGKTGGLKSVKLLGNQMGKFIISLMSDRSGGSTSTRQFRGLRMKAEAAVSWLFQLDSSEIPYQQWGEDKAVGLGDAEKEHTNLPPYKVGVWIKYVGV